MELISIRPSVGRLVSKTTPFVRFLLKISSNKPELRENQLTDSSAFLTTYVNFCPHFPYFLIDLCQNSVSGNAISNI